jgi:diadenosine tetraphosphatase ApaH/serine/threonine PP2A family protein phosphatase
MRVAIISDIHSNLEALDAVLEDAGGEKIDKYYCLGDIVGYGANPNECLQKVWDLTEQVVAGNHDHAAVGLTDISYFNLHARRAVTWTAEALLADHSQYLRRLPFSLQLGPVLLVHATPSDPPVWNYLLSSQVAKDEFEAFAGQLCFIGHSHQPIIFSRKEGDQRWPAALFTCRADDRYIINVGSVGQPRDGDPRASYAIYDDQQGTIQLRRVEYDIQTAQRKILQAGLPPLLAVRLAHGE